MLAFLQMEIGRLCCLQRLCLAETCPSERPGELCRACPWRTETGTGLSGQFYILPGNLTHFSEPPPAFSTVTTVNEVVTNSTRAIAKQATAIRVIAIAGNS